MSVLWYCCRLWNDANLIAPKSLCLVLVGDVLHSEQVVRVSASLAMAAALQTYPDMVTTVADTLFDTYKDKMKVCLQEICRRDVEVSIWFVIGSSSC